MNNPSASRGRYKHVHNEEQVRCSTVMVRNTNNIESRPRRILAVPLTAVPLDDFDINTLSGGGLPGLGNPPFFPSVPQFISSGIIIYRYVRVWSSMHIS